MHGEAMPMIYPKWIEPVNSAATRRKGVDVDVKDSSRLKRVQRLATGEVHRLTAIGKEAVVTLEPCGDVVRSYRTDFYIIDVFWHSFQIDKEEEEYLCLVGPSAIEFYSVVDNTNYPFPLKFTIDAAFRTKEGILLQRTEQKEQGGFQLAVYALTNPLSELTPVIVTGRNGFDPRFAFSSVGTQIVGASESGEFLLVHNVDERVDQLYQVRKCNKAEKSLPKFNSHEDACSTAFDLMEIESSLCQTPGVSSIFSNSASVMSVTNRSILRSSVLDDTPVAFRTPIQASGVRRTSSKFANANFDNSLTGFSLKTPNTPGNPPIRSVSRQQLASEILDMMPKTSTPFAKRGGTTFGSERSMLQYSSGTPKVWRNQSILSEVNIESSECSTISLDQVALITLECVWSENTPRITENTSTRNLREKLFVVNDMRGFSYLVMLDREAQAARLLELRETPNGLFPKFDAVPGRIECLDCAHVLNKTAIFVHEKENAVNGAVENLFSLFTGATRLGMIGMINCGEDGRVLQQSKITRLDSIDGSEVLITTDGEIQFTCHLSEYLDTTVCSESMNKIIESLSEEQKLTFLSKWYCQNNWRFLENEYLMENVPSAELLLLFEHIFTLCGFQIAPIPFFEQLRKARGTREDELSSAKRCKKGAFEESCDLKFQYKRELRKGMVIDHQYLLNDLLQTPDFDKNGTIEITRNAHQDLLGFHAWAVFKALHYVFESFKIDIRFRKEVEVMLSCLYAYSALLGLDEYSEYYIDQIPYLEKFQFVVVGDTFSEDDHEQNADELQLLPIFSSQEYLKNLFSFETDLQPFPTQTTWDVKLFTALAAGLGRLKLSGFGHYIGLRYLDKLELKDEDLGALEDAMKMEGWKWRVALFHVLRTSCNISTQAVEYFAFPVRRTIQELIRYEQNLGFCPLENPKLRIPPSLDVQSVWAAKRWKTDLRLDNVAVMLDSQLKTLIPLKPRPSQSEADFREEQEQFLTSIAIRTWSQSFGRACMIYHCTPFSMELKLHVSELCLGGRGHPDNRYIEINQAELDPFILKMFDWGNYYNGVSHGLALMGSEEIAFDPMWLGLCYGRQRDPITGAGVVLGFGLSGHIKLINVYTIHEWLTRGDNYLVISILLGCAVSYTGTCDTYVHKMVTTHLPFMLPSTLLELHINPLVQCAALFSLGMLFAESKHESLTSQIVNEMGRPVGDNHPMEHRGCYYLCGGFAIGLINLGKGPQLRHAGTANKSSIVSRLLQLMRGGRREDIIFPNETFELRPPAGHVYENDKANIHVTGLPATIAIGMLFMRTNCEYIRTYLAIPDNMVKIREIRDDFLTARTISRMLISFDDIKPHSDSIFNQCPPCVLEPVQACVEARHDDWINAKHREVACAAFYNITAGACIVLGIKYAGTHNPDAKEAIMKLLKYVIPGIRLQGSPLVSKAAGYPSYCHCINSGLMALGLVMSGSGDLETIRIMRAVRNFKPRMYDPRHSLVHATYLTTHMCLGLVFLGYGRYSFGTSNMDIAALLISCYPVVSNAVSDNRVYLKPLRFLWTIAAKLRLLVPVSVESTCNDPVENAKCTLIYNKDGVRTETEFDAPCLLPDINDLYEVKLTAEEYEVEHFVFDTEEKRQKFHKEFIEHHGRVCMRPLKRPVSHLRETVDELRTLDSDEESDEVRDLTEEDYVRLRELWSQYGPEQQEGGIDTRGLITDIELHSF